MCLSDVVLMQRKYFIVPFLSGSGKIKLVRDLQAV
jgi:hypothetical protein